MKIYFSGSIRGGRQDAKWYKQLIEEIKHYGDVLTEHIGSSDISDEPSDREIHAQDIKWLEEADILIAEVTNPSHGVGYEIGRAVALDKDVFCLYRQQNNKRVSAMINGSPSIECYEYLTFKEAQDLIKHIFAEL